MAPKRQNLNPGNLPPAEQTTLPDGSTITTPFGMEAGGLNAQGVPVFNFVGGSPETPRREQEEIVVDPNQWAKDQAAEEERRRVFNVVTTLRGVMGSYGLSSLMGLIEGYVREGLEDQAVLAMIRETPQYKERFPAMAALKGKQRAISEAEYIEFERNASQLERAYGLPAGMLGKDAVTGLLSNEVSAQELEQRVTLAAAGAFQASTEVRDTFSRFYGIDSGGLTAYFLDPDKALPLLNKQYAASQIGAEAQMQDFSVTSGMAERLNELGIGQQEARTGFSESASRRGFMQGRGDVVTQDQLISGTLLNDQEGMKAIERVQKGRVGRFQEGGGFTASAQGVGGLGSSATR
jgi:hypothetical protein